jgi:beta-fructofuranosidase
MAFRLTDRYTWDFWTAHDGVRHHLFFLNAPIGLRDPDHRHFYASVGHAVSEDLVTWTELRPALGPAPAPAWDDGTTWTGSVVRRPDGRWMMFYTGTSRGERFEIQRIGAAVSDDLLDWTRLPENPLVEIAGPPYERRDPVWHDEACRDPWVFQVEGDPRWHMVFTARRAEGAPFGRGTIAHAVSEDLVRWTVGGPLWSGEDYGQMEVPQVFELGGRWYCLFCVADAHMDPAYLASGRPAAGGRVVGTHYLVGDGPLGPFRRLEDRFLVGDPAGRLYAGRVVRDPALGLVFLAFLNAGPDGSFTGGLSDPMPVRQLADGRLRIDARRYGIPPLPDTPLEDG